MVLVYFYLPLLFAAFNVVNRLVNDEYVTSNVIATCINSVYVYNALTTSTVSSNTMHHFIALLIAYYTYDTFVQFRYSLKNKITFGIHHVIAIALLVLHAKNILPLSVGYTYLNLIEYSNFFLIPFQVCSHYNWKIARGVLAFPLFISYVPLRLVVIPYYSLNYMPTLWNTSNTYLAVSIFNLLLYVNVFSMYFACVMTHRFIKFIKNAF